MSQKLVTHKEAAVPGDYGQGCGHNLLGVGALGGALGLKAEMEERKLPGTVVYYGCPAEEVLTGKSFMARGHAFDGLDLCVDFHPGTTNAVRTGKNTALNSAIDLKPGMVLQGTVRNVIDFGAFVDIGVHQDGLVHISRITDRFIKHPSQVVKVGDIVKVKVLEVDLARKRINCT